MEGFWEFPGGKQQDHESIHDCLERELFEELSVKAVAREILVESPYEYEEGAINLIGIITELHSSDFNLSVHDKAEWVQISQLLEYKLPPADIPIAEEIIRRYGDEN
jgi:8-oxo-dGTP diphosphatase